MPSGYAGKVLRVNLTTGSVSVERPGDLFYRRYMGGWGFVAHYLLKELEPGIDPLGPKNKLVFAQGILTGAELSGSGRSAVGAKSPITGGFGEADAGGYFGAELARAEYREIESHFGHDAFLLEHEQVGAILREALQAAARADSRRDVA